jgi:hypothetical protein
MTRIVRHVCFICALIAGSEYAVRAQSFDLRTGQWDFTLSGLGGALGDISQLPPQARAELEALAKQTQNYKGCVTAQDLKDLRLGKVDDDDDEMCKVTSRRISGTVADMTRECTGENKRTETLHYEALSHESLRATIKSVSERGPTTITISGKWIGATCKD